MFQTILTKSKTIMDKLRIYFSIDIEQYDNIIEFENFKGSDYVEHLDTFIKYNKIGDNVNVEFNLGANLWTNPKTEIESCFTTLKCWKVEKLDQDCNEYDMGDDEMKF